MRNGIDTRTDLLTDKTKIVLSNYFLLQNHALKPDHHSYAISPGHGGRKPSSPSDDEYPPVYEEEDEEDDGEPNCFVRNVANIQTGIADFYEEHKKTIWRVIYTVLLLAYAAYFAYAMYYHFGDEGSIRLLWVTCLVVFCVLLYIFFNAFGDPIGRTLEPRIKVIKRNEELVSW